MTTGFPSTRDLGFAGDEETGWWLATQGRNAEFRLLRTLGELADVERLQEAVFGVTERDLIPANELIVVAETGGAVIGAFLAEDAERAAGVLVGWGGYVGRPRIVSDFLAVRSDARNLGLAEAMKRLQAVVALARGFEEIVWTVDPLRAANARLNFGKLGAVAREYEIDRYGAGFAADLYGGMPTDRLHVVWEITTPRVIGRLTGTPSATPAAGVRPFVPGTGDAVVSVVIPADIDSLLVVEPAEALAWRLRLRETLTRAFAEGFAITGFQPASRGAQPMLLLECG